MDLKQVAWEVLDWIQRASGEFWNRRRGNLLWL